MIKGHIYNDRQSRLFTEMDICKDWNIPIAKLDLEPSYIILRDCTFWRKVVYFPFFLVIRNEHMDVYLKNDKRK